MPALVAATEPQMQCFPKPGEEPAAMKSRSWLWLGIAAALLLFANGADNVPLAAWLAPVFVLRFVRTQRFWTGPALAYLLVSAALAVQFRGMVPIPGIGLYIFLALFGVPMVLPYVADRLLAPRLRGFAATLVFPASGVVAELLLSRSLYGTWASIAYTQYGNLPLLQVVSVTGLWGITFLIAWFAGACNWLCKSNKCLPRYGNLPYHRQMN
jgi:apolipoprotein N-acyltransferase